MLSIIYIYVFVLWTLFWSFSSVIIDRIKNKKTWIISGRSECPKCKHKLWIFDLIPIFSFLSTWWKCRYCKEKISFIYPILEISTWILFLITSYFLIDFNLVLNWNFNEIFKLWFFLLFWFLSIVYIFYDILYLEIPDSILFALISITFITIWLQSVFPNFTIIEILPSYTNILSNLEIYYLLLLWIFMIWSFYFIMLKWLKEIYDILIIFLIWFIIVFTKYFLYIDLEQTAIWSAILGSFFAFLFLFIQIIISGGNWMWGWDLRIAILLWLISGIGFSFYSILLSYLFWSIVWIFIIAYTKTRNYYIEQKNYLNKIREVLWLKTKKVSLDTKMPFWPFLALWIYWVIFFSDKIKDFINLL